MYSIYLLEKKTAIKASFLLNHSIRTEGGNTRSFLYD